MRVYKKLVLLSVMVCVLCGLISFRTVDYAFAEETYDYEVQILDEADLLTEAQEADLYEDMAELVPYGNVLFSTVTLDDYHYEEYSENLYFQIYGNEPGVHFMIDMGNRKLVLSASTEMEKLIGRERDTIIDNVYQMATDEMYDACARECFHEIYLVLNDGEIAHTMRYITNAIMALILGILINFVIVFSTLRSRLSEKKIFGEVKMTSTLHDVDVQKGRTTKRYDPISSGSSSGGGSSGGSSSSGGGGGFSGGSSSHGF